MNIYVGNLHYDLSEDQLREIFEDFGTVNSVKIITDKFSGKSKGFGFVEMADDTEANQAMEELNDAEVKGRSMRVNQARERTDNRRSNDRQQRY
ncbi:MAG: RNA-binding protein [Bacteroidales bacterium]|nr:RNA-binding protein [Bacteroidales bacterium]MCF8333226.1 RNA-binding protein [Bacteroidales bacterium]